MDPKAYYLAHMRLAKVQINTWGHSDSCGINTIDYFGYLLNLNTLVPFYSRKIR